MRLSPVVLTTILPIAAASSSSKYTCFIGYPVSVNSQGQSSSSPYAYQHNNINWNGNPTTTTNFSIGKSTDSIVGRIACNSRTTSTSLNMGLGSFIRKKLKGDKGKNDNDDANDEPSPKDVKAALEAIKADLEAIGNVDDDDDDSDSNTPYEEPVENVPVEIEKKERRKLWQNNNKKLDKPETASSRRGAPYGETVQQRINRVKSGGMTEEEKAAFLNTALTRKIPDSKKKSGPPIRQKIPSVDTSQVSLKRTFPNSPKASPAQFPTDPLWNSVIGKGKVSTNSIYDKNRANSSQAFTGKLDETAKKNYLNMVTNPDRFKQYAAMGGKSRPSKSLDSNSQSEDLSDYENDDEYENQLEQELDDDISTEESSSTTTAEDTITTQDTDPNSLASRLEKAATLQEQREAELKIQREAERLAEKERIAELKRKEFEEMQKRNEERLLRVKLEKEELELAEQLRREMEEKRMADMRAAQDAYWAKKLAEEREKRDSKLTKEQKELLSNKAKEDSARAKAKMEMEARKEEERNRIREEVKANQDPHEAEILKEAEEHKLHERERNYDIMEAARANVFGEKPKKRTEDVSASAFVQEQARKKAELDKLVAEQRSRLAALNSPLPQKSSQSKGQAKTASPSYSYSNNTFQSSIPKSPPRPPGLSLNELTMGTKRDAPPSNPSPIPETPSSPSLSLKEMTMLNDNKKNTTPPPPPPPVAQEKKGPIRQRVLVQDDDDDEDDDFFTYSRGGSNKNMSIKDIRERSSSQKSGGNSSSGDEAKQKAKMWGIDIDKFK